MGLVFCEENDAEREYEDGYDCWKMRDGTSN